MNDEIILPNPEVVMKMIVRYKEPEKLMPLPFDDEDDDNPLKIK